MYNYKNLDGNNKFEQLRKDFKTFVYQGFNAFFDDNNISVEYNFHIDNKIFFKPTFSVLLNSEFKNFNKNNFKDNSDINNFLFHIGMIELLSYWKATCASKIIIIPYQLNEQQIKWWKELLIKGLGEFFYLNNINFDEKSLVEFEIHPDAKKLNKIKDYNNFEPENVLVPIGGGKDSAVSLEILKKYKNVLPFIINLSKTTEACVNTSGIGVDKILKITRKIDENLLTLNSQGFLNGHTPFSAIVAFYSIFISFITNNKWIALSNESSANEPTVLNSYINHQYSKTVQFEENFRNYYKNYIIDEIEYFSFLRPLNEIQIAKIFSRKKEYHNVFRSCNVGSKKNIWCCNCSKCLFAYIILSPFIKQEELIAIFGENLLDKESLKKYFDELCGISENKPFECVGTIEEVNLAIQLTYENLKNNSIPKLLSHYFESRKYIFPDSEIKKILNSYNENNFLNAEFSMYLTNELKETFDDFK